MQLSMGSMYTIRIELHLFGMRINQGLFEKANLEWMYMFKTFMIQVMIATLA